MNALCLAIGTFTILPARMPTRVDRATARGAMLLAPLMGILLGAIAALVLWAVCSVTDAAYGNLLGAVLAVALLAYLTRALHLDGLADTADALGSGRRGDGALEIARRGDVGPFGVVTLVLVLLIQATALAVASDAGWGALTVIVAVVTGRLAAVVACTRGIPAASPEGLGALVAGTVPRTAALAWVAGVLVLAAAAGAWLTGVAWAPALAVIAGLSLALGLVARSAGRLGGINGDVLGAAIEVATSTVLVVLAVVA
ncbi:MAG: adenosylcobinamide-GDP ribazoletransferase [Actinobacteria bacterium]|nr:adenosylcobinamide-GDP ribazoletransferase [Actinomycetota bacterium]